MNGFLKKREPNTAHLARRAALVAFDLVVQLKFKIKRKTEPEARACNLKELLGELAKVRRYVRTERVVGQSALPRALRARLFRFCTTVLTKTAVVAIHDRVRAVTVNSSRKAADAVPQ